MTNKAVGGRNQCGKEAGKTRFARKSMASIGFSYPHNP